MLRSTIRTLFILLVVLTLTIGQKPLPGFPLASTDSKAIKDLYHSYEVWSGKGIKFVVRNDQGHYVTWGIGKLESWNGTRTVLTVRNPKGQFLTWAKGRIESWKNDQKRYVFRDKKGHFLQWAPLDFTSKADFSRNLKRLQATDPRESKHFGLLLEIITETVIGDLKQGNLEKAYRFMAFSFKAVQDPAQKAKISAILIPVKDYLKGTIMHGSASPEFESLASDLNDLEQLTL